MSPANCASSCLNRARTGRFGVTSMPFDLFEPARTSRIGHARVTLQQPSIFQDESPTIGLHPFCAGLRGQFRKSEAGNPAHN